MRSRGLKYSSRNICSYHRKCVICHIDINNDGLMWCDECSFIMSKDPNLDTKTARVIRGKYEHKE